MATTQTEAVCTEKGHGHDEENGGYTTNKGIPDFQSSALGMEW